MREMQDYVDIATMIKSSNTWETLFFQQICFLCLLDARFFTLYWRRRGERERHSGSHWGSYHESQHARPPCPSPTPRVHSNSCASGHWCHPAISSFVVPFSSCPQSLPASGSFPMSQLFTSGGQSIWVSALASVLPMNTQDWSPLSMSSSNCCFLPCIQTAQEPGKVVWYPRLFKNFPQFVVSTYSMKQNNLMDHLLRKIQFLFLF